MADPSAESSKGLSTGVKVLIGCLGCFGILAVTLSVATAVGGFAVKRQIERFVGGLSEQQEATETMRRVSEEHPFEVPADGVVTGDRLERFLAVTEEAWEEIEPWAEDVAELQELGRQAERGEVQDLREMIGGFRSIGGFARARVQLAEALEEVGMPLDEYVWTGLTLTRAAEAVEEGEATGSIPPENVDLVRSRDDLPRLTGEEGEVGPGLVLAVATLWGMADGDTWNALGLDTLVSRRGR